MANDEGDMLKDFLDESQDRLKDIVNLLVDLEQNSTDDKIINAIFLPVHTIKGNCAYFALYRTKDLTHELETILDLIRKKNLVVQGNIISTLIEGIEYLEGIFNRLQKKESEIDSEEEYLQIYEKIKKVTKGIAPDPLQMMKNISKDLKDLLGLLSNPEKCHEIITKTIKEIDHVIVNGSKPQKPEVIVSQEFRELEKLLAMSLKDLGNSEAYKKIGVYLQNLSVADIPKALKDKFEDASNNFKIMTETIGYDELLHLLLNENLLSINSEYHLCTEQERNMQAMVEVEHKNAQPKVANVKSVEQPTEEVKTTRIAEKTIDGFLSNIGELILVREMFNHFFKKTVDSFKDLGLRNELRRLNDIFLEVTNDLEGSVMKIRKQSVKKIFQRVSKMVRDITKANGKEVEVKIVGGEIEIDKSLIDVLDAPIMHMIRNAVDHGIETPEVRKKCGKDAKGLLLIELVETEDSLLLTIKDDGKGLDLNRIYDKALKMGVVKASDVLSDQNKMNLIFHPGLSTADKVSDISGRGVGMDVVRTDIEKIGGQVLLNSTFGKGTTFSVELPKSVMTQIIQGFVIRVVDNEYVIPIYKIIESFPCIHEDIATYKQDEYFVKRHGNVLPIVELSDLYNQKKSNGNFQNGIFIFIEEMNKKIALFADQLLGIQQVVVKPLKGFVIKQELFTGGALMGDGRIALVVNTDYFFNKFK